MYKIYKTIWSEGQPLLQFVADVVDLTLAKQKAKQLKGLVKCNDQIHYDYRR